MADFSKLSPDNGGTILNCKDATARTGVNNAFKVMGEMGAKNLFNVTVKSGTWGGVVVTVDDDQNVTYNGTKTDGMSYNDRLVNVSQSPFIVGESYIISGFKNNQCNAFIRFLRSNDVDDMISYVKLSDTDENTVTVPTGCTYIVVFLEIPNNTTLNNLVISPMARFAADTDNTRQRFVKTNKQLTDFTEYKKGDTIKGRLYFANITAGTAEIQMIVTGKFKTDITGATISNSDIRIRGINGYVKTSGGNDINGLNFADYFKVSQVVPTDDQLFIGIKNTNNGAFQNVTNNTIVSVGSDTEIIITLS